MKARFKEARRRMALLGAIVTCGIATAAPAASAATFTARETHRGLLIERADGTTGRLLTNGWFRRPGEPGLVYREGSVTVAGVWKSGPDAAVVRSGTSERAPVIGRIVPSWNDGELRLTIEPTGSAAVRTTVFERTSGGGAAALDRGTATRVALQGTYRATLHATGGGDAGWLSVDIDPEGRPGSRATSRPPFRRRWRPRPQHRLRGRWPSSTGTSSTFPHSVAELGVRYRLREEMTCRLYESLVLGGRHPGSPAGGRRRTRDSRRVRPAPPAGASWKGPSC